MRKTVIVVTVLIAGIFGVGYMFGQIAGVSSSAAAGVAPSTGQLQPAAGAFPFRGHSWAGGPVGAPHADGQVTAVNGDTVTVKADADRAGSNEQTAVTTIVLTATTQYGSSGKAAITVGSYIRAEGTLSSDGKTLTATTVEAGAGAGPGPRFGRGGPGFGGGPHADGTVTAVNGNTITVKPDANQVGSNEDTSVTTILLTSTTTYDAGHDVAGTTSKLAIAVGSYIIAEGTVSADGRTLTATQVDVRPGGAPTGDLQPSPNFNGPSA